VLASCFGAAGDQDQIEEVEPMSDQRDFNERVASTAVEILIAIDRMMAEIPPETDLVELAEDLVSVIASESRHQSFVGILNEAMVARQALIELGIKI
jgi:hypothetical protein